MAGYAILTCSKTFEDGSIRKVRIVRMDSGVIVGEISTPKESGEIVSPDTDQVAVVRSEHGIKAAILTGGTGMLMEVIEYEASLNFRASVNPFNACDE
jgi:hypothetical protein